MRKNSSRNSDDYRDLIVFENAVFKTFPKNRLFPNSRSLGGRPLNRRNKAAFLNFSEIVRLRPEDTMFIIRDYESFSKMGALANYSSGFEDFFAAVKLLKFQHKKSELELGLQKPAL